MQTWQFLYFSFNKYIKFTNWTYWSFYLYGRFESGRFETRRFETWRFVNLTFCKPDVLKPNVLKPDVLKPDVLCVYRCWGAIKYVGVCFHGSRPLSRPPIFHGHPTCTTVTFLESGRDDSHLTPLFSVSCEKLNFCEKVCSGSLQKVLLLSGLVNFEKWFNNRISLKG